METHDIPADIAMIVDVIEESECMMIEHEVMTPEEVASYLRLDEQTTYRLLRAGKLPGVKIGKQWRIWRADLDKHLRGDTAGSTDIAAG